MLIGLDYYCSCPYQGNGGVSSKILRPTKVGDRVFLRPKKQDGPSHQEGPSIGAHYRGNVQEEEGPLPVGFWLLFEAAASHHWKDN